ncbi:hypothetical protein CXG81DRAFT_9575 [Caulochytrium protostelioides]|uniref:Ubiquitin thioesterase OTU n=1 Tax=Caulochytrium protostelioides TaxID=1555241 RepID=A0A4P9X2A1_9FUNG|nr:OTU-domain-containing protein [Caulochytrium protostelioides]RKP03449.1 hypothetical protein CXG81DRAFT_9575 [Caulochytrium protostelioides]|eukprot:RKP03449.1 hypothetical protein CXG81DRAFT_9575 [Caulochytrium protostelioides]
MDDDNSCLFRAVSYVLDGHPRNHPSYRELAAVAVQSDTDTFSEAVLGRPPDAYVAWITGPDRWGGAIELAALAQATRHELLVADVETGRIDVFGEGQGHPVRSALVYSGIHYDAAEIALPDGRVVRDVTADPNAEAVRVAASALRAARQFTNTAQFTLRCSDCGQALRGEKEAQSHAASRGHVNFVEY